MHPAAFVILLTFMAGAASPMAEQTIHCPTQACVDRVLAAAPSSRLLSRLRVFRGNPGNLGAGATVWHPLSDMWFS